MRRFLTLAMSAGLLVCACAPRETEVRSEPFRTPLLPTPLQWVLWPDKDGVADLWLVDVGENPSAYVAFSCTPGEQRMNVRTDLFPKDPHGAGQLTIRGETTLSGRLRWPPLQDVTQARTSVAINRPQLDTLARSSPLEFQVGESKFSFTGMGAAGKAFAERCARALKL